MTDKATWKDLAEWILFGIAGAAIGYGAHGTLTAACTGFGIGLLIIPAVIVIAAFIF